MAARPATCEPTDLERSALLVVSSTDLGERHMCDQRFLSAAHDLAPSRTVALKAIVCHSHAQV